MRKAILLLFIVAAASHAISSHSPDEVWAYLMKGEETYYPDTSPITDIACFSAQVDGNGNLKGGHLHPPALSGVMPGTRYHLVITIPWSTTQVHIFLNPELPFRDRIIADIVTRSQSFDGIQIDFESIDNKDGTAYLNFLAAVKKALPEEKLFSVAVMARWAEHKKQNPADAFDYPFIARIADRVIVMAYDEHYRGGGPGPIASLPWCERIYTYARSTIDSDKLVMGIPLYGRSWQSPSLARAYKNSEVVDELLKKGVKSTWHPERGGTYSFTETVTVTVHYETVQSLEAKRNLYSRHPIRGVAYWRISQEPAGFWKQLLE